MPDFKNRENKRIQLPDGTVYFHARSTAVVNCILCLHNGEVFALMAERGKSLDQAGKWCVVCGYLDWDETLTEAVKRETYEETAIDVDDLLYKGKVLWADLNNPYHIESDPSSNRQNISLHYGILLSGPFPELPVSKAVSTGELEQIEWVRLSAIHSNDELKARGQESLYAFNHNEEVHQFVRHLIDKGVLDPSVMRSVSTV